jgi:cation transport ATPase
VSGRDLIGGTILIIGGAAILAAAVVHGMVNVPHLRGDMLDIAMRPRLVGAISLVMYFSVVAMGVFGMLVLSAAAAAFRGRPPAATPLLLVAGGYVTFGLAAFVRIDANVHFLGYASIGLIVAAGAILSACRRGVSARSAA